MPHPAPRRLAELDALRVIAFGLLILYHVGMFYVSWDWHVKSPRLVSALEGPMTWLNPWRMSLLFVISGAATALMASGQDGRSAGAGTLLRERSSRLLLPLLFGMVVIVPPQPWLEVVEKLAYGGSYLDFLTLYFSAYPGFCRGEDCLKLPTWNHLWFLPYLWCYTMLALLARRAGDWAAHPAWSRLTRGARLLWVPWLLFALLRQHLLAHFPTTHALVDDWYSHALYLPMFLLGFALFGTRDDRHGAWATAQRLRWAALLASIAVIAGFQVWSHHAYAGGEIADAELMALRALSAARQWLPIVALMGWARQLFEHRDGPLLRWLTLAVFPCYIVHQTLIVLAAHVLAKRQWPLPLEAGSVIAITAIGSLAAAWLAMRVPVLRPWMGLAPRGRKERG